MSQSWEQVKALLDDPYVSADTKQMLVGAYMSEHRFEQAPSDFDQYSKKYAPDFGPWGSDPGFYGGGSILSTDALADAAKEQSAEDGYHARQVQNQVDQQGQKIENQQAPAVGGGGVQTSDEIFDLAKPALSVFQTWAPIDAKVPADSRGVDAPLDFNRDIQTRYDEQRGISFKKFMEEAEHLLGAHSTLSGVQTTTENELNTLYKSWTGPAANASYEQYSKQIAPNVTDLLPYLEGGGEVIEKAVQTVFEACKSKAEQVNKLYRETVGSATPEIAEKVMKMAGGDVGDQDDILEVAAWIDSVCGSNLEQRIRDDDCGLNDSNKDYTISQCKKWIRESFNVEFWGDNASPGMASQFKKICDDTVEAVDGAWQTINDYLKDYQNKFPQTGAGPGVTQPGQPGTYPPGTNQPPPSTQQPPGGGLPPGAQQPPPNVALPPAGTGGGGTGGGGTGGGHTPSIPDFPLPGAGGGTDTSGAGGSHLPGGTDGGGLPSVPTPGTSGGTDTSGTGGTQLPGVTLPGAGGIGGGIGGGGAGGGGIGGGLPVDPVTGLPQTGGKEVTINDGKRTLTVGEPDANGRSKITIDEGDGKPPKTFTMDFDAARKALGSGALPGSVALPGAGGTEEDDPNVLHADADGKVVIHDGTDTITAERVEGEPDKMKITVDDGSGKPPETFTVDFHTPGPGDGTGLPSTGLDNLPADIALPGGASGDGSSSMSSAGNIDFGGGGGHDGASAGGGGGGGGFGNGGGGGSPSGPDASPGSMSGAQAPGTGEQQQQGVPAGAGAAPAGGPAPAGGFGGGGMPMGGMGGGAGQGGDHERSSKWRTQGDLFTDEADPAAFFGGVVGQDPAHRRG